MWLIAAKRVTAWLFFDDISLQLFTRLHHLARAVLT